jgi:hypothetical protein
MNTTLETSTGTIGHRRRALGALAIGLVIITSVVTATTLASSSHPEAEPLTRTAVQPPDAATESLGAPREESAPAPVTYQKLADFPPYLVRPALQELRARGVTDLMLAEFPPYLIAPALLQLEAELVVDTKLADLPPYLVTAALEHLREERQTRQPMSSALTPDHATERPWNRAR